MRFCTQSWTWMSNSSENVQTIEIGITVWLHHWKGPIWCNLDQRRHNVLNYLLWLQHSEKNRVLAPPAEKKMFWQVSCRMWKECLIWNEFSYLMETHGIEIHKAQSCVQTRPFPLVTVKGVTLQGLWLSPGTRRSQVPGRWLGSDLQGKVCRLRVRL